MSLKHAHARYTHTHRHAYMHAPAHKNHTAAIIHGPVSQVVLPRQSAATFQCMVNEFGLWFVNNTGLDDTNADIFQIRGITYDITEVQSENGDTYTNLTLFVEIRPENNGTQIQCYSYGTDVATSSYASLIIAG